MKLFCLFVNLLILCSCQYIDSRYDYPGDRFSYTAHDAPCDKVGDGIYQYQLKDDSVITVYLNSATPEYEIKGRGDDIRKALSTLHYGDRIDSSLRYLIRESMSIKDLKALLGPEQDRWGSLSSPMLIWPLMDERYLAILPSTLNMPTGMNSYNLLNEYKNFDRTIILLPIKNDVTKVKTP